MIDTERVKHVAKISKINITDEENEKFSKELSDVLNAFSLLKEVDTVNIKPSFQPIEKKNIFRDDIPEKCLSQDEALENSEQREGKFFKGPRSV